MRIAHLWN